MNIFGAATKVLSAATAVGLEVKLKEYLDIGWWVITIYFAQGEHHAWIELKAPV